MTHDPRILTWRSRPYSWSQHSSFLFSPEQWHDKYILGIEQPDSPELIFGKTFADSCEARTPLAPVTLLSKVEHPFEALLDGIPLVGYADTLDDTTMRHTGEYKTGVKPWDKKRVDAHGQITLYCLMNYLTNKVRPEETRLFLEWVPTKRVPKHNGDMMGFDYDIEFASEPPEVLHFETERTLVQTLEFALEIKRTRAAMESYAQTRLASVPA